MLNLIRRAASLTRARHSRRGRHRRPSMSSRGPAAPASTVPADEPTVALGWPRDELSHRHPLTGEDAALVRPYVLACERSGRHPTVVVAPCLPPDGCSALLGVR